jgi:hypothetical protein
MQNPLKAKYELRGVSEALAGPALLVALIMLPFLMT